jgi:hypothetical protein
MNLPDRSRRRRSWRHSAGLIGLQFAAWWCTFYVAMVLLAFSEEVRMRRQGLGYLPPWSFHQVKVGEFQVATDGRWGVAVMGFSGSRAKAGIVPDVVLFDLDHRAASRLGLSRLRPRRVAIEPQGDSFAIASDQVIYVTSRPEPPPHGDELMEGDVRVLYRARDEGIERLVFLPDGRRLAAVCEQHTHLLSFPDGGLVRRVAQRNRDRYI